MSSLICSAPGRVCLFGDHMDWCGRQVITAAVDMRIFLEGNRANTGYVEVHSFPPFSTHDRFPLSVVDPDVNSDLRYARGVISAMNRTIPYTLKGMNLRFHPADHISTITGENRTYSDLPASKGLSSSAAMSVTVAAVTEILHKYPNLHDKRIKDHIHSPEFQKKCAQTAYQGEHIELGINCGQMDPYASALGGILHIDCSHEPPNIEKYAPKEEMTIIIGDTNQPKDTPRILAWLGKRFQQNEETFMEGVTKITEIVRQARQELSKRTPNIEKLGTLIKIPPWKPPILMGGGNGE